MRRQGQGQYPDSGINPMVAAQMQNMLAQRSQQNSGPRHLPGISDSFQLGEEHRYASSKEVQWQWGRDAPKGSNQLTSQLYAEGQVNEISRTLYEGEMSDSKLGMEMQAKKDPRAQAHQDELDARFNDSSFPQTFEGLEQKFLNDIMNLTKEQQEAEDRENARHRERLNEINVQYQEKLLAVRARQATHREEFLRKESQARHQQYQQANVNSYDLTSGANAGNTLRDPHRGYATGHRAAGHYDSSVERDEFTGGSKGRGSGGRGPYPGGRDYSNRGQYF